MKFYLNREFSQHIVQRQKIFEEILLRYLDSGIEQYEKKNADDHKNISLKNALNVVVDTVALSHIRKIIRRIEVKSMTDFDLFRRVILTARDEVFGWGGQLYFVFLPSWVHFDGGAATLDLWRKGNRDKVLKIVHDAGIPIIDILPYFAEQEKPGELFLGYGLHYSVKGYNFAAQGILRSIDAP